MDVVAGSVSDVLDASDVLVGFVSAEVVVLTEASSDAHETTTTASAIETRTPAWTGTVVVSGSSDEP